ncbi:MAG: hypothetical protein MZV64_42410 [Ignavibacteriales bacterium]|nr:hypothetical protein [Ignavibacteriales bacterium]
MTHRLPALCAAALLAAAPAFAQPAPQLSPAGVPHHRLDIRLDPAGHRLAAVDEVKWPPASACPARGRSCLQRRVDDHARRSRR